MNPEKTDFKKELSELAPVLSQIKKQENFELPAHYFEELQQRVWERIRIKAPVKAESAELPLWLLKLSQLMRPQYAASIIIVLFVCMASRIFQHKPVNEYFSAEIITEYLLDEGITSEIIADELSEQDLRELEIQIAFFILPDNEMQIEILRNIDETNIIKEFL